MIQTRSGCLGVCVRALRLSGIGELTSSYRSHARGADQGGGCRAAEDEGFGDADWGEDEGGGGGEAAKGCICYGTGVGLGESADYPVQERAEEGVVVSRVTFGGRLCSDARTMKRRSEYSEQKWYRGLGISMSNLQILQ